MEDKPHQQDGFDHAPVQTPTAPQYESTYGGYDNTPDQAEADSPSTPGGLNKQMAVLGVTVSSFCVTLSCTKFYPDANGYENYALLSGVIGTVFGIVMLCLMGFAPTLANESIIMPLLSAVLAVYWTITSMVTTFKDPFAALGNGYISVYASTIFSVLLLLEALPGKQKTRVLTSMKGANDAMQSADLNQRWVGLCLVASIVEMIEGAIICDMYCHDKAYGAAQKLSGFAVAVGVISIVASLVMLISAVPRQVKNCFALFLSVWWTIALIVLTFSSHTFTVLLMNGYLGTWAAAIASYGLVIPLVAQFGWFGGNSGTMNDYDEVGGAGHNDGGLVGGQDEFDYTHSSYAEGTGGAV